MLGMKVLEKTTDSSRNKSEKSPYRINHKKISHVHDLALEDATK